MGVMSIAGPRHLAVLYDAGGHVVRMARVPCSEYSEETGPRYIRLPEKGARLDPLRPSQALMYRVRDFERTWYRVGIPHGGGLVLYYRETGTTEMETA